MHFAPSSLLVLSIHIGNDSFRWLNLYIQVEMVILSHFLPAPPKKNLNVYSLTV